MSERIGQGWGQDVKIMISGGWSITTYLGKLSECSVKAVEEACLSILMLTSEKKGVGGEDLLIGRLPMEQKGAEVAERGLMLQGVEFPRCQKCRARTTTTGQS